MQVEFHDANNKITNVTLSVSEVIVTSADDVAKRNSKQNISLIVASAGKSLRKKC